MSRQQRGRKAGAAGWRGAGPEGHPPCTSALGLGTPARSSRTAGESASCSPCGRCLHGQGKKNTSAALPEEARSGGGVAHLSGSGFSAATHLQSGDHLHQGVLSPSPQSPQYPKIRASNEEPHFSVLILTPDSVSRLMKLSRGSCTE